MGLLGEILNASNVTTVTALIAGIAPATAGVLRFFEFLMKWQSQRHEIEKSQTEQSHKITTDYLSRALNPETPIAIRSALLRFLATPANKKGADRLQLWASAELAALQPFTGPIQKQIEEALNVVNKATDEKGLRAAEAKLQLALGKQHALLAPPPKAPLTPEAIRAGLFNVSKTGLEGLSMPGENLEGAALRGCNLMSADFRGANLRDAELSGSDLRGARFEGADLTGVTFYEADARGAKFVKAILIKARLWQTHVEQADFTDAESHRRRRHRALR